MLAHEHDKTQITIYVHESVLQAFNEKFVAEWPQWGGSKGAGRRADRYRPQDYYTIKIEAMTTAVTNDLDAKYATLQEQKKPATTSSRHTPTHRGEDEDMDGGNVPGVRLPKPKGDGRGAHKRQ